MAKTEDKAKTSRTKAEHGSTFTSMEPVVNRLRGRARPKGKAEPKSPAIPEGGTGTT